MSSVKTGSQESDLRLNDLDWEILDVMSDGQRYTQQHLYDDIEQLDDFGDDWIRKRISHLYDNALIDRVGSSAMYTINENGRAALQLRDESDEVTPVEFGKLVREKADEMTDS